MQIEKILHTGLKLFPNTHGFQLLFQLTFDTTSVNGKSGWRSGHQSRLPPLLQCCMWIEFQSVSRSQPDFEGFLRALRFPPSAKLTPSLIQYAGPY